MPLKRPETRPLDRTENHTQNTRGALTGRGIAQTDRATRKGAGGGADWTYTRGWGLARPTGPVVQSAP